MIEAVISDADGTLVDTVALIRHGQYETATTFLTKHGVPLDEIPAYEAYKVLLNRTVGGSARQTLERTVRALYEDRSHHLEGMDYEELHRMLNPVQDRLAPEYVRAYPGLAETLSDIGAAGIKLAITTSGTPHHVVRNFGVALGRTVGDYATLYQDKSLDDSVKLAMFVQRLERVFHIPAVSVISADDVGDRTKPDPLSMHLALERLGVEAQNSLVLGDHSYDMLVGINANIVTRVGVTHGFDDRQTLLKAGATHVIDSLPELVPLLR